MKVGAQALDLSGRLRCLVTYALVTSVLPIVYMPAGRHAYRVQLSQDASFRIARSSMMSKGTVVTWRG
jgi:hypothetical protein